MNVTALLQNFRTGIAGLVPCFERVGIPWRRPDAYDEWDAAVAAVFEALVVAPIRASLPQVDREAFALPAYDMMLDSYAGLSVIEVAPAAPDGDTLLFHALGTSAGLLDAAEVRRVDQHGLPRSGVLQTVPLDGTTWAVRLSGSRSGTARPRRVLR